MIFKGKTIKNRRILARILKDEGIVIMKCDTIYGILGKAPQTEKRLIYLKGRPPEQQFLRLIHSADALKKYTNFVIPEEIAKYWPGPLTLIVPCPNGKNNAFRIPADPYLRKIIKKSGGALFSTSVNESGKPHHKYVINIIEDFGTKSDAILDSGDAPEGVPSTILNLTTSPYTVIREGKIKISEELLIPKTEF